MNIQGIKRKLASHLPFSKSVFSEGIGNSVIILLPHVKTPFSYRVGHALVVAYLFCALEIQIQMTHCNGLGKNERQ